MCDGEGRASPDLLIARGHCVDTRKQHYTHRDKHIYLLGVGGEPNRHIRGTVDLGSVSRHGTVTTNHSL